MRMDQSKKLSLIVPVYFEEECIEQFIKETEYHLNSIGLDYEYIFVDDGSKDRTVEILKKCAESNKRIKLIEFSYNHGKQAAVSAGIICATGDYLLYMDPDLQDPPEEIVRFIEEIEKGYDLVFGIRKEKKDTWLNTKLSNLFWTILEKFTGLKIPTGLAVMRIFNRKFADQFKLYGEKNRFIEGMFMHIGMNWKSIEISQRDRFAGVSKFNFKRKIQLAFNAILDYSDLPLKMAVRLGFFLSLLGFALLIAIVFLKLFVFEFQAGWPSVFGLFLMGFGLQFIFIGIIALYLGKIYKEVKNRPLYSIRNTTNI
jgi:glycosyltransferase involved in cell wall biosynthesis